MEQHEEEYLNLLEPVIKDESVREIQWREIDADNTNSINTQTTISITFQDKMYGVFRVKVI